MSRSSAMFCLSFSFAWGSIKDIRTGTGERVAQQQTIVRLGCLSGRHLWMVMIMSALTFPGLPLWYPPPAHIACFLLPSAPASFLSVSCTSEHLVVGSPFTNHASMNSYGTPRSPLPFLLKSEVAMSKAFDDLIYKLTKSCCNGYYQKTVYQS